MRSTDSDEDFSNDEASHDALFHDEASYDALSHDEASHDADEAVSHASAASFPYDPNNPRGSVIQSTGDPDNPEVGFLLVRGNKKEYDTLILVSGPIDRGFTLYCGGGSSVCA
jgi:hypothetical protein